ncbi:E3 ubiquitin-protein ligase ATL4-like [Primulina eburnea]|uniref:E3 ubiquitin-protein ligase ATL4-like n=1 Tax=Primulina eburnea TaxID=1245227 RepID=UPI003C6C08B6
MSTPLSPPPTAVISQVPPPYVDAAESSTSTSTSIILVIIIIASSVILSASIYILLRLLSCRFHRAFSTADDLVSLRGFSNRQNCHAPSSSVLDSLPLFTFSSVTGNLTGGDCAVCLSKFEPHDQLRLLPLCCHAFHAACIDTWILSNQTCPLCRSTVLPSDADVLDKILSSENRGTRDNSFRNGNSGSFRIEIGSVSRRRSEAEDMNGQRQSYSIGSFEYVVGDNGYEVPAESTAHRRGISDCTSVDKDSSVGVPTHEPPGDVLAAEVSSGRNWLRDYVDRLTSVSISRTMSFRSSGRFFSSSSRRSDPVSAAPEDLEANSVGEEISELFRWLSGI